MDLIELFKRSKSFENMDKRISCEETQEGLNIYSRGILYRTVRLSEDGKKIIVYDRRLDNDGTEIPVEVIPI